MIRKGIATFLLVSSLMPQAVYARAVWYFDCKEQASAEPASFKLTAFVDSGLVDLATHETTEIIATTVQKTTTATTFSGQSFRLVVFQDSNLPTMTYLAELTYRGSNKTLVCEFANYEQPEAEVPGGVSVHN